MNPKENIPEEDLKFLTDIEGRLFSSLKLGFDLRRLNILDDVNVSRSKIEELGSEIAAYHPEISTTILRIAHSIYFSRDIKAQAADFFDAVIHMGADRVKITIFALTLFSLERSRQSRIRAAKSAGIAMIGKAIAEQMNMKEEYVGKVEAGGLFCQLGKNIFLKMRELGLRISEDFIRKYETYMSLAVINKLQLAPFLKKVVDMSSLEFDEDSLSIVGIIKLAEAVTEDSFIRHGKLVLRSPLPDEDGIVTTTPAVGIRKIFEVLGVEDFLQIIETPTQRQIEGRGRRRKD